MTKAKCPRCGKTINPAAILGAMGKGKPKTLTAEDREFRADQMAMARSFRWKGK